MNESTKDVTIEGREFQIGRVPANIGNWIVLQMMQGKSTELENYEKITAYLFSRIKCYKIIPEHVRVGGVDRIAESVFENGKWLNKDLQNDIEMMNALYTAAIDFNFGAFFKKRLAEIKAEEERERLAAQSTQDLIQ